MKRVLVGCAIVMVLTLVAPTTAQEPSSVVRAGTFRVRLLGTAAGPTVQPLRLGISTLVEAGAEKLLFDCGRGSTTGLIRLGIPVADVRKLFITHLHSDHVVGVPELYLFPWASAGRKLPLEVWGPAGTQSMMDHLQQAFAFDIHVRRDVDEKFSSEGIRAIAHDIAEGVIYESNGVKVTAFEVDHAPVRPAFGFRVDYHGHSVVMSGDTRRSEDLIRHAQGVDVLIHEIGAWKNDPQFKGPPDTLFPGTNQTRQERRTIAEHHTDAEEVGGVFDKVKPKLAVLSHYTPNPNIVPLVRKLYSGPFEPGEDGMTLEIGASIDVVRLVR